MANSSEVYLLFSNLKYLMFKYSSKFNMLSHLKRISLYHDVPLQTQTLTALQPLIYRPIIGLEIGRQGR